MDDVEIRCYRDAVRSKLRLQSEARRRLIEAETEAEAEEVHVDAAQIAGLGVGAGSSDHAADDGTAIASGDDSFYPLDEPDEDAVRLDNRWDHNEFYSTQHLESVHGIIGYLQQTEEAAATGYHGNVLLSDDEDDTYLANIRRAMLSRRLHVPQIIENTPSLVFNEAAHGSGFGGVPASAAAIAGLKKENYDGSGSDNGSTCVICMKDYKKGKGLLVMPCEYMHRFHGKCLKNWLSRSHLCPLCRHALPTTHEQDVRSSARPVPM